MNRLIILLMSVILSGCVYQSLSGKQHRFINNSCKDKGGIYSIEVRFTGNVSFWCTGVPHKAISGSLHKFILQNEMANYVDKNMKKESGYD